jgi:hypothetical protein
LEVHRFDRLYRRRRSEPSAAEHPCGLDEHRNSLRIRARMHIGLDPPGGRSRTKSTLQVPRRPCRPSPRSTPVRGSNAVTPIGKLDATHRLAGYWVGNLLRVRLPSQQDRSRYDELVNGSAAVGPTMVADTRGTGSVSCKEVQTSTRTRRRLDASSALSFNREFHGR